MKRTVYFSLTLCVALALSLMFAGCTSSDKSGDDGPPIGPGKTDMVKKPDAGGGDVSPSDASTAKDPADVGDVGDNDAPPKKPDKPKAPGNSEMTAEIYWKVQLERLKVTKQNYEETLKIYTEHKDDPASAEDLVRQIKRDGAESMRDIFKKYDISPRDFYPRGSIEEKKEKNRLWQEYRRDHPEINDEFVALRKEINALREQIMTITGDERGKRPRPRRDGRGPRGDGKGKHGDKGKWNDIRGDRPGNPPPHSLLPKKKPEAGGDNAPVPGDTSAPAPGDTAE